MFNFLGKLLGKSTKNTVVAAMRRPSILENKVHINRAKRSQRIEAFLKNATDEEKKDFVKDFFALESMLTHYSLVSERLTIFIDNNIIQDILQKDVRRKRNQRFHSLLAILCLAQDYYLLDIFACVSPAVLFEAGEKKINHSSSDINKLMATVNDAIAEAGLTTHYVGFQDARELPKLFKQIALDEQQIRLALDKIIASPWYRQFTDPNKMGTKIPFAVADEECPPVRLQYFSEWYVKFLLMHMIEKRMFVENKGQDIARGMMIHATSTAFSILKRQKDGVEGLGDIELLTYCDLTSQTLSSAPEIRMALTYDDRLYETLTERSGVVSQGVSLTGGRDNVADFSLAFAASFLQSNKRTNKVNKRANEFHEALCNFLREVVEANIDTAKKNHDSGTM